MMNNNNKTNNLREKAQQSTPSLESRDKRFQDSTKPTYWWWFLRKLTIYYIPLHTGPVMVLTTHNKTIARKEHDIGLKIRLDTPERAPRTPPT